MKFDVKSELFHPVMEQGVCVLQMNHESMAINSFSETALEDLRSLIQSLNAENCLGLVFLSTKKNHFAAGVDIGIFEKIHNSEDGYKASKLLNDLFVEIQNLKIPTVAAIHGTCLGGGLELSLACSSRISTDHSSTQFGLPEVQLGVIPGGGGTQRLPRLIGIAAALDLILTGKKIDSKKALKLGLVDRVCPENQLRQKAIEFCLQGKLRSDRSQIQVLKESFPKSTASNLQKIALESNFLGRQVIRYKSNEQVKKMTKGRYPAPLLAIEVVLNGIAVSLNDGLDMESRAFGTLVVSPESRSLVHIFRTMTAAKRNPFDAKLANVAGLVAGNQQVAILGAGLMGSGIATVLVDKGIRTVLLDRNFEGVQAGIKNIEKYFSEKMRRKKIKKFDMDAAMGRVLPTLNFHSARSSPLVIEAAFEELSVKHDLLRICEQHLDDPNFVFASNTSSIPISNIAAAAKRPENVLGMHFFSPVTKMPLVEIIVTDKTRPGAASTVFEAATKMGKNIIVVRDGPGFFTTRILAFMLAEALSVLAEGASIAQIDAAMEEFGMPVGPVTLIDEVGIDVASHIIKVLNESFSDRLIVPKEVSQLLEEGRKGRKNNFGFYTYEHGVKGTPDLTVEGMFTGNKRKVENKEIVDRCVMVFVNEAARCLDEGIVASPADADLGAVFGLGFPPFLGGPFHWARARGYKDIVDQLTVLAEKHGKRFVPALHWSSK